MATGSGCDGVRHPAFHRFASIGRLLDPIRRAHEYLLTMIDMRLPSRQIDVSRLLRSQIREHAARHARRFALCRHSADLKLPTRAQHDAFEDAVGAAEMYLVARGHAGAQRLPRQRSDLPGATMCRSPSGASGLRGASPSATLCWHRGSRSRPMSMQRSRWRTGADRPRLACSQLPPTRVFSLGGRPAGSPRCCGVSRIGADASARQSTPQHQ